LLQSKRKDFLGIKGIVKFFIFVIKTMDRLQDGKWEKDFIDAIKMYADIFCEWIQINDSFYYMIISDITCYTVHGWPESVIKSDPKRCAIETKLVARTIEKALNISGYNKEKLKEIHAYETFIYFIIRFMNNLWSDFIREANSVTSGYIDKLIKTYLIHPPGSGISYLCLKIASKVKLTEDIINEIECSRDLTPNLPFTSEDLKSLLEVSKKEMRLRLALCLAQELGQAAAKLHVELTTFSFDESIWNLMQATQQYNDIINRQHSRTESIKLILLGECLKYSSHSYNKMTNL
jgi:hypothetical protein